eukprot:scaffold7681_cov122-Cylindrotheca_fusiformis.AAC.1
MDDSIPALKGRAVLIKGRSSFTALDNLESFHRNGYQPDTEAVHRNVKEDIGLDETRQNLYWRLIMPRPLDNVVFSGGSRKIVKNERGVKQNVQGLGDIMRLVCFWTIAVEGACRNIAAVQESSVGDLFA